MGFQEGQLVQSIPTSLSCKINYDGMLTMFGMQAEIARLIALQKGNLSMLANDYKA